jgi:ATP adenylyltransferase
MSDCPFCVPDPGRVFHESSLVLGVWDAYPVSPGHALLVTRRHVATWFDATREEQTALLDGITRAREEIERRHRPDGYNVGVNVNAVAGQTVFHLHVHVIPRYRGDVANPRGGVRHVIPRKADYPGAEVAGAETARFEGGLGHSDDGDGVAQCVEDLGAVAVLAVAAWVVFDQRDDVTTSEPFLRQIAGQHHVFVEFELHQAFRFSGSKVTNLVAPDKNSVIQIARTARVYPLGPVNRPRDS